MIVTRGGKEYQPSTDPAIIAPKQKDMSHAAFVLWETMIGLILHRQEAVGNIDRINTFYETLERNPEHSKKGKILARINTLHSGVLYHECGFLNLEQIAHSEWRQLKPSDRMDQGIDQMYNTNSYDPLPPLWTHPLGESSPPAPFPISTTALQLASPALIRVYQGGKR